MDAHQSFSQELHKKTGNGASERLANRRVGAFDAVKKLRASRDPTAVAAHIRIAAVAVSMVYFWACEVSESKSAVVKVPEGFVLNVCNATLASDATVSTVSLGLETSQMENKAWKGVVAHLGAAVHAHQVKLDLVFTAQSKFYVAKGTGKINLTGYFQPGPPADFFESATTTTEAATPTSDSQSSKKNKKRARDEPVTWDQVRNGMP